VKRKLPRAIAAQLVLLLLLTQASFAQQQGKVVINEYMPWTSNTCGTTSEFVELLNFGPGPVNISCYILTTGIYSVTIPPNTILKPGEFYVIAGRDVLPGTCGNVDSTSVRANLNWNNCNCTNTAIPTSATSEGMMADNGYSPLVLLDPSLKVIDAIVRGLPGAATAPIVSSSVNGACTSRSFNLGTMNIDYEVLGMAPGSQNSFARTLDGDCVWLKQPNQSGNASNNRRGNITDISYEFIPINLTDCGDDQGTISIFVKHSNYSSIFPMTYTVVLDANNNKDFDSNDSYRTDTVYNPPFIEIANLPLGSYRITVASVKGCYLRTFPFDIITCNPGTLPLRLLYFKNSGSRQNQHYLEWLLQDVQNLQSIVVEKSVDGQTFSIEKIFFNENFRGDKLYSYATEASPNFVHYRLKLTQKNGHTFYSPVLNLQADLLPSRAWIGPNPVKDRLHLQIWSTTSQKTAYSIYNVHGQAMDRGSLPLQKGQNQLSIPVQSFPPGNYQLVINGPAGGKQPISLRFVKH
jgi:hypothetical protein